MGQQRELKKSNYYPVYYWMSMELGLSGVAKDLYAVIFRFSKGRAGCCYCSYDQFKKITGASVSTVKRTLTELEKDGLIIRERLVNSNSSYYRVNIEKLLNIEGLGKDELEDLSDNDKEPNKWNDFIEQDSEEQALLMETRRVF